METSVGPWKWAGRGTQIEELKKCSLWGVEKWALSEVKQESESSEKDLRPWKAVQNLGAEEVVNSGREVRSWEPFPSSAVYQLPWEKLQQQIPAHACLAGRCFLSHAWRPSSPDFGREDEWRERGWVAAGAWWGSSVQVSFEDMNLTSKPIVMKSWPTCSHVNTLSPMAHVLRRVALNWWLTQIKKVLCS